MSEMGLLAVGNALVDVLAPVSDEFVENQKEKGMLKGAMTLIDHDRATELYNSMPPATEMSGGSAANTIASFASFGGKGAYIGKVSDDQLGNVFKHDMSAIGVNYTTSPLTKDGVSTGRCLILVTPDAERTMNTYLGAAVELGPDDIDPALVSAAQVTYLEGYLFDPPQAKEAFRKAGIIAHDAGRRLSLSLSDPFCVGRHREDFKDLVANHVDILFANEEEIMSLYETSSFEDAVEAVRSKCEIAVLTRSEKGSVILSNTHSFDIEAVPPSQLVDSTGAGDSYAAGFLYGFTQGMSLDVCGKLGAKAATEIISHMGPRAQHKLSALL